MKVSVLVLNWNGADVLPACLDALEACDPPPHEIIVVDNGSSDGSAEWLRGQQRGLLKTLFLEENLGYAAGNNAGWPLVSGEILALLNNDTEVDPDWIGAALPHFREARVGMVACKTLRYDKREEIDKVGHLIFPDGLNRGRASNQADDGRFDTVGEALWPDGSGGFYRVSMLHETGLLDEDFFLYGEDAELGMRARWAGYACRYAPASMVYHHHSAGLGRYAPEKLYYVERNRLWLLLKTFPLGMVLASPFHTFHRYAMNVLSLLLRRGAASEARGENSAFTLATTLMRALLDGVFGAPKMWAKRKQLLRRISHREMRIILQEFRISARDLTLED